MSPQAAFLTAAAEFIADDGPAAEVVQAAAELVAHLSEPPDALVTVAALPADELRAEELAPLLDTAAQSLGLPTLSPQFAVDILIQDAARKISTGLLVPYQGASKIWYLARGFDAKADRFGIFMQLMDDWESDLPGREKIEQEIRETAADFAREPVPSATEGGGDAAASHSSRDSS